MDHVVHPALRLHSDALQDNREQKHTFQEVFVLKLRGPIRQMCAAWRRIISRATRTHAV